MLIRINIVEIIEDYKKRLELQHGREFKMQSCQVEAGEEFANNLLDLGYMKFSDESLPILPKQ